VVDSMLRQSLTSNFAAARKQGAKGAWAGGWAGAGAGVGTPKDGSVMSSVHEWDAMTIKGERVEMANLRSSAVLKRHRSYVDIYDMFSSHMWEKASGLGPRPQRRKSFPSYTAGSK
jgi:hypothetical protein